MFSGARPEPFRGCFAFCLLIVISALSGFERLERAAWLICVPGSRPPLSDPLCRVLLDLRILYCNGDVRLIKREIKTGRKRGAMGCWIFGSRVRATGAHRENSSKANSNGKEKHQPRMLSGSIMKTRHIITLSCALLFLALLPKVQGAPESALPGFNTADGDHALFNVSSGVGNAAFGWYSLFANTTNSFNTALGAGTLALATADDNTAVGAVALLLNSSGSDNTALGTGALLNNTTGISNTA